MFCIDKVHYDFQTFYINYANRSYRYRDTSLKRYDFFKTYDIKALPLQALIYQCSVVYYKL